MIFYLFLKSVFSFFAKVNIKSLFYIIDFAGNAYLFLFKITAVCYLFAELIYPFFANFAALQLCA